MGAARMTFRHQIRVGSRLARGRSPIDAAPPPSIGEQLQAARERKGVDLHRAERDTKIRAKHLAALESGDYSELPGPVYVRGFLKNYAAYLGLDGDELVSEWRFEQEEVAPRIPQLIALPPQPLIEPKGHLRFTRGIFVGALLLLIIVGFLGYVGVQLLRFSHPPTLALSAPSVQTLDAEATTYPMSGTVDLPYALITVNGPDAFAQTTNANSLGDWSVSVPVTKGRNDFSITARDPQLPPDKGSAPLNVILTVPIAASPSPRAPSPPAPSESVSPPPDTALASISFTSPADGHQVASGTITVYGLTNATAVSVTASWGGAAATESAAPSPAPPAAPAPVAASVAGGSFSANLTLPEGRWVLTASAASVPGQLASNSASVTVDALAPHALVVQVRVTDKPTWITVTVDGAVVEPGRTFHRHESETYVGDSEIVVTTEDAGNTQLISNGKNTGSLGPDGQSQKWKIEKGKPPKKA
jgi:hypothetical protein